LFLYKSKLLIEEPFIRLLDLIFPPSCAGCGKLGVHWCDDCYASVKPITQPVCEKCGLPVKHQAELCNCADTIHSLDYFRAYSIYTPPLSNAIKQLKYERDFAIAKKLAFYLIKLYNEYKIKADLVIPVPLNKNRIRERGFNQASLLAKFFANELQLPYEKQALVRTKNTRSQVGLSRLERLSNVQEAFQANPALIMGKTIIIIDDVSTTGATLEACASTLKNAGAMKVIGLSLARAVSTQNGFSDFEIFPTSVN